MEQNTETGVPTTSVVDSKQKSGNGLKIATVVACIMAVCGIGFGVYGLIQSSQKDSQISDLKSQVMVLKTVETEDNIPEEDGVNNGEEDFNNTVTLSETENNINFLLLPKVGLKIPLPQAIVDKINLEESDTDNGYRISVKMIDDYRAQGHCGNGGSGLIGFISKENVDIVKFYQQRGNDYTKTKSNWSNATIAKLKNDVVYPKEYVVFNNYDAVCLDYDDGGSERKQEVAKEVQEINDALEAALLNAKPIE